MAIKGQKFRHYSYETKLEAIHLKLKGKTYKQVAEELGIRDDDRVKIWMRKYRQQGELGLMDRRGKPEEVIDQERHYQRLKEENRMLKKCLAIWTREVRGKNTR